MDTRRMMSGLGIAVLALTAGVSQARDIFFDTFSGNQLRPHWQQPPPNHWEHTVADSRVTVSGLFHPGVPGQPNVALIAAEFPSWMGDRFVLTAQLGWDSGQARELAVRLLSNEGLELTIGYDELATGSPRVFLQRRQIPPPPWASAPAPNPGLHTFRLEQTPDDVALYVNGQPIVALTGVPSGHINRVELVFRGNDGAALSPLHVGLVRIVPAPGSSAVIGGMVLLFAKRRRR